MMYKKLFVSIRKLCNGFYVFFKKIGTLKDFVSK